MTIESKYQELCITPSDIFKHLPTLRKFYDECTHITEFGVRGCVSLHAALSSNAKKVVAYDIANVAVPECDKLEFHCADVLTIDIEETDFLFIDTLHTYRQLKSELERHSNKVRKYIGFHDTDIFGQNGEDGGEGLLKAIAEFMVSNDDWNLIYQTQVNNGLTILKKV